MKKGKKKKSNFLQVKKSIVKGELNKNESINIHESKTG